MSTAYRAVGALSTPEWTVRDLCDDASFARCLELRFDVLCGELGYCNASVTGPCAMRDRYDAHAVQLGIFSQDELAGITRVVADPDTDGLPTVPMLPGPLRASLEIGRLAEVSRVIVAQRHRGRGLFVRLLAAAFMVGVELDLGGLLISEKSSAAYQAQLTRFGFVPIFEDYWFEDQRIAPSVLTTTYVATPLRDARFYASLLPS